MCLHFAHLALHELVCDQGAESDCVRGAGEGPKWEACDESHNFEQLFSMSVGSWR